MAYIETPNLPVNAAQESGGNLAAIAAAQGTGGTGISPPTGASGILGWLSGIYNKISSTLNVSIVNTPSVTISGNPVLGAGTNIIGQATPTYVNPSSWDGSARDMRAYGSVLITCTVAPSVPYSINVSPDNASDFIPQTAFLNNNTGVNQVQTVSGVGTYSISGRQFIKLTGGTGGTIFIAGGQ